MKINDDPFKAMTWCTIQCHKETDWEMNHVWVKYQKWWANKVFNWKKITKVGIQKRVKLADYTKDTIWELCYVEKN